MMETKTISVPPVTKALDVTKKIFRGHQATMKLLGTRNKLCKMLPFSKPPTESSGTWFLYAITWICMITRNRINNNNNNDNNSCNNISMKSCNKVNKHSIISSRKAFELPWVVKPRGWGTYLEIRKSLAST